MEAVYLSPPRSEPSMEEGEQDESLLLCYVDSPATTDQGRSVADKHNFLFFKVHSAAYEEPYDQSFATMVERVIDTKESQPISPSVGAASLPPLTKSIRGLIFTNRGSPIRRQPSENVRTRPGDCFGIEKRWEAEGNLQSEEKARAP